MCPIFGPLHMYIVSYDLAYHEAPEIDVAAADCAEGTLPPGIPPSILRQLDINETVHGAKTHRQVQSLVAATLPGLA